jgi:hypothetical protein
VVVAAAVAAAAVGGTASAARLGPTSRRSEGGREAAFVVLGVPSTRERGGDGAGAKSAQTRVEPGGIVDREGGGCSPHPEGGGAVTLGAAT